MNRIILPRMKVDTIQLHMNQINKPKTSPEEIYDTNQTNLIRFMNDTIHQFMNRFKIHKTHGKMEETSYDTIQIYLNQIKLLETYFFQEK